MQPSNEIIEIFSNLDIQVNNDYSRPEAIAGNNTLAPESISFLEDVLKIYKANIENKITKTVKAIKPLEKLRLEDIALLQYDLITDFFRNTKNIENYYYFNNPITAKVVAHFNLNKIITKIKEPHSPFKFNEERFIQYYCYYYKTLKEDDKKELFFIVDSGSDKVFVFFNSWIEAINKDIFKI